MLILRAEDMRPDSVDPQDDGSVADHREPAQYWEALRLTGLARAHRRI